MILPLDSANTRLKSSGKLFLELFRHGSMSVEIYKPEGADHQKPHEQDELYVIISGTGEFFCNGSIDPFKPGDMLFVPAGIEHRFMNFSQDFSTWVVFYGPKGGEHAP